MAKFDTHGGHFSPQGYLRVNEGGSHEENPNGGVQIGVDPQGIPNMLEEGEPVYNDYVYSDNIQADPDILEKYNIPASFAGKFYSQIADSFVDEAEERPLDPISTNGLNAMLSRLAEAQEEQKQIQQQKELEEELAQLSPEELAELDAMLAEQEQPQVAMPAEAIPQEQYPTEPIPETEQMMPMEQPMMSMACGGFIKKYDMGGPADSTANALLAEAFARADAEKARRAAELEEQLLENDKDATRRKIRRTERRIARNELRTDLLLRNLSDPDVYPQALPQLATSLGDALNKTAKLKEKLSEAQKHYKELEPFDFEDVPVQLQSFPQAATTVSTPAVSFGLSDIAVPEGYSTDSFALGGKMNKYAAGGWEDFINRLNAYSVSRNPGGVSGTYRIDRRFPLAGYNDIKALEDSEAYRNFTNYVLNHQDDPNVQSYLRTLDAGTAPSVEKLFNGDGLRNDWRDLYNARRYDQKGGIYHFSGNTPEELEALRSLSREGLPSLTAPDNLLMTSPNLVDPEGKRLGVPVPRESLPMPQIDVVAEEPQNTVVSDYRRPVLSTFPQYVGALGNAGLALWNAVQPADRYEIDIPRPYLPYGRINLVDPTYNPMDQNAGVNNALAASAATNAAIAQSGAGYAAIPAMLANGYNTGRAMGDTLASIWDANNQRRNAVLAGVNNNRAQTAQFNYANERDRAGMLNQYGYMRSRNNLMQQQLNYGAEGQKYGAIGQMLGNTFDALSGIGRNNVILNQINTNRKNEGFGTGHNGVVTYTPGMYYGSKGGFLKKYK